MNEMMNYHLTAVPNACPPWILAHSYTQSTLIGLVYDVRNVRQNSQLQMEGLTSPFSRYYYYSIPWGPGVFSPSDREAVEFKKCPKSLILIALSLFF